MKSSVAQRLVVPAAAEEPRHRQQLDVRERDQEVGPEEDVELGRVQPLDRLVVDREVEDDEEVLGVVVDLRALSLREHVLEVERMPAEPLRELRSLVGHGRVEVDPGETGCVELSEPGPSLSGALGRPLPLRTLDARQARHRY